MEERSDIRWWLQEGDDAARSMLAHVDRIRARQEGRRRRNEFYASLYGTDDDLGPAYVTNSFDPSQLTAINIVNNMVEAAKSHVAAKSKPKPTFVTEGGNWDQRVKAEGLDKAVSGVFYLTNFYAHALDAFRDGEVYGTGHLWIYADMEGRKVTIERGSADELVVDEAEARHAPPRSAYRRRFVDRTVLMEMFPEHRDFLETAADGRDHNDDFSAEKTEDMIAVTEGWHLRSGPKAKDGGYLAAVDGVALERLPYDRDYFPFAPIMWEKPLRGWYGVGLVAKLCALQLKINDLLMDIDDANAAIRGKWMVEERSNVSDASLNDERDAIARYRGTMPVYQQVMAVPPDTYKYLEFLLSMGPKITGLGEMTATSTKPAGVTAAVALNTLADQQSGRFLDKFQAYEEFVLLCARLVVDAIRDLAAEAPFRIKSLGKDSIEHIDFGAVDLDEEAYELKVFPTSMLPQTPAGRMQWIQDMSGITASDGSPIVSGDELLDLLDFPDTETFSRRRNGTRRLTESMLAKIARTGKVDSPEPQMDFEVAIPLATLCYLEYRERGLPGDRLGLIGDWIAQARELQKMQNPAPPANDGAPPMDGNPAPDGLPMEQAA